MSHPTGRSLFQMFRNFTRLVSTVLRCATVIYSIRLDHYLRDHCHAAVLLHYCSVKYCQLIVSPRLILKGVWNIACALVPLTKVTKSVDTIPIDAIARDILTS